jgi:hypothetical protein
VQRRRVVFARSSEAVRSPARWRRERLGVDEVAEQDRDLVAVSALTLGTLRRVVAWSSTSSCRSVAVWIISTTAPIGTCASVSSPEARPASSTSAGRSCLPRKSAACSTSFCTCGESAWSARE